MAHAFAENSTNVRKPTSRAGLPAPARTAVSLASHAAPGLVARVAARFFLTPPRHAAPAAERAAASEAEPLRFRHGGQVLRGWQMGSGPVVLLVHGWGGRAGQLLPVARALAAAGCRAVAFDGPGHGRSDGRTASVPVMAKALVAVAREVGARAAVAHSFGGGALAFALGRGELSLDAAVVVGAPRSPAHFLEPFCEAMGFSPQARRALRARLEALVGLRLEEVDVVTLAPAGETPLLVLHDRGDAEVPFAHGAALAEAWPGARLDATEGLGHRRILRDPRSVGAAVAFVTERLPRCACGRLATAPGPEEPRCEGCELAAELWAPQARWPGAA